MVRNVYCGHVHSIFQGSVFSQLTSFRALFYSGFRWTLGFQANSSTNHLWHLKWACFYLTLLLTYLFIWGVFWLNVLLCSSSLFIVLTIRSSVFNSVQHFKWNFGYHFKCFPLTKMGSHPTCLIAGYSVLLIVYKKE